MLQRFEDVTQQEDLLREVLNQIYKDLNVEEDELKWDWDDPDAYTRFRDRMYRYFQNVLEQKRSSLMQILYRVDISEKQSARLWPMERDGQIKRLCDLVLNRCLQKVLTRRMFRHK
ncbi:MAG: hypothetical protein JJ975_11085 [Bacteroidia bacterium]|nr:hypothetical protein [Bacteroidia bacterium]